MLPRMASAANPVRRCRAVATSAAAGGPGASTTSSAVIIIIIIIETYPNNNKVPTLDPPTLHPCYR